MVIVYPISERPKAFSFFRQVRTRPITSGQIAGDRPPINQLSLSLKRVYYLTNEVILNNPSPIRGIVPNVKSVVVIRTQELVLSVPPCHRPQRYSKEKIFVLSLFCFVPYFSFSAQLI